jgi:hypothetical protein
MAGFYEGGVAAGGDTSGVKRVAALLKVIRAVRIGWQHC